jgi:hypothetical protein
MKNEDDVMRVFDINAPKKKQVVYLLLSHTMSTEIHGVYSTPQKAFDYLGFECPIDPENYIGVNYYLRTEQVD